jgi:hypothetical protein
VTPSQLRLHLSLIVTLAGGAAFLFSVAGLWFGVDAMSIRYPLAAASGYATFLLLIRGWIAWHRRASSHATRGSDRADLVGQHTADLVDVGFADISLPTRIPKAADSVMFAGGRSGGGGAGGSWAAGSKSVSSPFDLDVDADDLWPIVLAVVCVLGAVIAIAWVIYSAPVLLAEVAVDAAIVSGVYRKLKKREPAHWAMTVVRHTALPAVAIIIFATLAGYALQKIAPDARSIGGVMRSVTE